MAARELTRDEKKKIRRLVTGMCANYDGESGLCFPLDCSCYTCNNSIVPVFILIQNPCTVIYDNFIICMIFHEI